MDEEWENQKDEIIQNEEDKLKEYGKIIEDEENKVKEWVASERERIAAENDRKEAEEFRKSNFTDMKQKINDKLKEVTNHQEERDALTKNWEENIKKIENELTTIKNQKESNVDPQKLDKLDERQTALENEMKSITNNYFEEANKKYIKLNQEGKQRDFAIEENKKLIKKYRENIPLKRLDKKKDNDFQEPIKTFETYFTDFQSSVDWIEDPIFKNKVIDAINNIDKEGDPGPETYRNILLDSINDFIENEDSIINDKWDEVIFKGEKEKFKQWQVKFNLFRDIFMDHEIIVSPSSKVVYDFINTLEETYTPKTGELNGFKYKGKKIIARNKAKVFKAKEIPEFHEFLNEVRNLSKNANCVITENLGFYTYSQENKDFAKDYNKNLRERQKELIKETTEEGEFFKMEEFNEINNEIRQIRNNKRFKFRPKIWYKSMGGLVKRIIKFLWRFLWFHKKAFVLAVISIITMVLTGYKYEITIDGFKNTISKGTEKIAKMITNQVKKILKQLGAYAWIGIISGSLGFVGSIFIKIIFFFLGFTIPLFRLFLLLTTGSFLSLAGIFYFIIDFFIKKYGFIMTMFSYYLSGKQPSEEQIAYLAEEKNMEIEDFKDYYLKPENFYNNTFANVSSYPVRILGYSFLYGADFLKELILTVISVTKYISIFFFVIFILYIINRWRS